MAEGALFLDRDGIINVDKRYVHRPADFDLCPGFLDLGRCATRRGMPIIVVTNQSGIGRGYFTESEFAALTDWMVAMLSAEGVSITAVEYCPYHPTEGIGEYRRDSDDRKPGPGMILRSAARYDVDLARSVLIGDQESDIAAARSAHITTTILVGGPNEGTTAATYRVADVRAAASLFERLVESPC